MDTIAIIMPVYNELHVTKEAIETLFQHTTTDFQLIVVDDCSSDGTQEYILSLKKNLVFLQNKENQGVHKSWNIGVKKALELNATYICIINNDIIFTCEWEKPLVKALKDGEYVVVSPYHTIQNLPEDFPKGAGRMINPVGGGQMPILGCCFMMKSDFFKEFGLFPEQMKHYFGDNWIKDIALLKNYKCGHIYDSYIHHWFCVSSVKLDNTYWFKKDGVVYNKLSADGLLNFRQDD